MAIDPERCCLLLLKRRLRSRQELEFALARKGVPNDQIAATIGYLGDLGLVNDLQFARAWVNTRDRLSPRGAYVLTRELQQKGIAGEIIEQVLSERQAQLTAVESNEPSEEELARRIVAGRERVYANLDRATRKRRLMNLLNRRGFSYDLIHRILDL